MLTIHLSEKLSLNSSFCLALTAATFATEGVHFVNQNNSRAVLSRKLKQSSQQSD